MSTADTFPTVNTTDLISTLDQMLDAGLPRPVGIKRGDSLGAYLISRSDLDGLLARLDELEDLLWLAKAELARKEGFADPAAVRACMGKFTGLDDAQPLDHA